MTQVLSWIFGAGYWFVFLAVLLRALMMLVAYVKSPLEERKKSGPSILLSAVAEVAWCALVWLSFSVSRTDFIPLMLSVIGLSLMRRIAPFERVGSQHVYSLLSTVMPKKQASLARATAMHLF